MIIRVKTCPMCGKEYEITSYMQIFCSKSCANRYNALLQAKKIEKITEIPKVKIKEIEEFEPKKTIYGFSSVEDKNKSIFDIAAEAAKAGTTYGKYVGAKIAKENPLKKKEPKNKGDKK